MATLERAIAIAAEAHEGQTDKGGAPYILHPLRVMMAMNTEEERIVAVLHDVLEDCPSWGINDLARAGFSEEIIAALFALARKNGESYDAFIHRLKPNPLARAVKLADLADNSDMSRLTEATDRDRQRLQKYRAATFELTT